MEDARRALAKLDPQSRALLDLSLRRGLDDEDIGNVLRVDPEEVRRRRAAAFERLASDLGLGRQEERDELFATLQDLPADYWGGQPARA
jgi:DNA-directed RNA polymerase specialized sigma24 family protein